MSARPSRGLGAVCLPFAVLSMLAFLVYERHVDSDRAVFPRSLRQNPRFTTAALFGLVSALGVFALTFLVSNYVQSVAGQPAFWAGAVLAPASIASVVTAPIAGRRVDSGRARRVLQIGFGASAAGTALCALIAVTDTSWLWFLATTTVFGIGNGYLISPLTTVGMSFLRTEDFSPASSLLNVLRQTGPVVGGAVVGLLVQVLAVTPTASDPLGLSGTVVAAVLIFPLALFTIGFVVYSLAPRRFIDARD
ncbi:MFS transporter [Propionibacterium acidifaciens]|uniref:MFS transporter n=2 Tax=Propionibacterium acidifaciens TaxID=556499 RepID=UPI0039E8660C